MTEDSNSDRQWIKVGEDPLRFEYGRDNDTPGSPSIKDQLAYVEEEKHSPISSGNVHFPRQGGKVKQEGGGGSCDGGADE